jgi:hypothetical protein
VRSFGAHACRLSLAQKRCDDARVRGGAVLVGSQLRVTQSRHW